MHLTVTAAPAEPQHPHPHPAQALPTRLHPGGKPPLRASPVLPPSVSTLIRLLLQSTARPAQGPVLLAVNLPKTSLAWATHRLLWGLLPPLGLLFRSSTQSDSAKACVCILSLPSLRSPGPPRRGQSTLTPPPLLSPWLSPGGLSSPSRSSPAPAQPTGPTAAGSLSSPRRFRPWPLCAQRAGHTQLQAAPCRGLPGFRPTGPMALAALQS